MSPLAPVADRSPPLIENDVMASIEQTMMKVQRILTGPMGLRVTLDKDRFRVSFEGSSTALMVRVAELGKGSDGEGRTVVLVESPILFGVTPTPELFEWVARNGGSRWFGHIEVHDIKGSDNINLFFTHTLLGDFLDHPELETAMFGVLQVADEWDDQLQARFGGEKWADV